MIQYFVLLLSFFSLAVAVNETSGQLVEWLMVTRVELLRDCVTTLKLLRHTSKPLRRTSKPLQHFYDIQLLPLLLLILFVRSQLCLRVCRILMLQSFFK